MLWRPALCIGLLLMLTGCWGMHRPMLIEPPLRTCDGLELDPVEPRPVTDTAWFSFCLPDSGYTTLVILNSDRKPLATLVDEMLCADVYEKYWQPPDSLHGYFFAQLTWRNEPRRKKFSIR